MFESDITLTVSTDSREGRFLLWERLQRVAKEMAELGVTTEVNLYSSDTEYLKRDPASDGTGKTLPIHFG